MVVTAEDVAGGKKVHERFDMVVLAAGMEPQTRSKKFPGDLNYEENGFLLSEQPAGIFTAGVAKKPSDVTTSVQDATASAIKSIQIAGGK